MEGGRAVCEAEEYDLWFEESTVCAEGGFPFICLRTKVQWSPPIGELSLLPTPESHWYTISIDFIVELPESHSYNAIMNVIDSVSKVSHFILTHTTITALGAACLFLMHIWKLHGLLKQVVSN